jgi:hypothetical protein
VRDLLFLEAVATGSDFLTVGFSLFKSSGNGSPIFGSRYPIFLRIALAATAAVYGSDIVWAPILVE